MGFFLETFRLKVFVTHIEKLSKKQFDKSLNRMVLDSYGQNEEDLIYFGITNGGMQGKVNLD